MSRTRQKLPVEFFTVNIDSLNHDGRGIAHVEGKVTFIEGALPGETVKFKYTRLHSRFDEGQVVEVLTPAANRVTPDCPHFTVCGGCSLQHLAPQAQIEYKQRVLLEQFWHFSGLEPLEILPPLTGAVWGYRHKARLGVRYVEKKQKLLVGFREKHSHYLADLDVCKVLHPAVGESLDKLKQLIQNLEACKQIAQIEVAVGEEGVALVIRNLIQLGAADKAALCQYAEQHQLRVYLQPRGPESVELLWPQSAPLHLIYRLPEENIVLAFHPLDFTQVNPLLNRKMITQVLQLLDLKPDDKVLDLFCGLGNFTLPIAKYCAKVVGVEGSVSAVERAQANAVMNHVNNAEFFVENLAETAIQSAWAEHTYNKILLDPPRSGALELVQQINRFQAERIVYVSCNPATLARDAGILVHQHGYHLSKAGVMDMFPHTSHVESIALFEK